MRATRRSPATTRSTARKTTPASPRRIAEFREVTSKVVNLLSERAINVTQQGVRAYVQYAPDGGIVCVNIPHIADDADDATLDAIRGYIDHEVAHVLFTDPMQNPVHAYPGHKNLQLLHQLYNILEDTRIERSMQARFPGSAGNLDSTLRFVIERHLQPEIAKARAAGEALLPLMIMPLFRSYAGGRVAQEMLDGLDAPSLIGKEMATLAPFRERVAALGSTADATALAHDILTALKDAAEPPPPPPPAERDGESEEKDDSKGEKPEKGEGKEKPKKDKPKKERKEEPKKDEGDPSEGEGEGKDEEPGEEQDEGEGADSEESDGDADDKGDDGDKGDTGEADDKGDEPGDQPGEGEDGEDGEEEGSGGEGGDEGEEEGDDAGSSEGGEPSGGDAGAAEEGESEGERGEEKDDGEMRRVAEAVLSAVGESRDADQMMADVIAGMVRASIDNRTYLPFTTDFDKVIPVEVDAKHKARVDAEVARTDEAMRGMVGQMQAQMRRMFAQQAQSVNYGGQRRGRIQANALHRLAVGDDRVFSRREEHDAQDTAITLLVDLSGSMCGARRHGDPTKIKVACQTAYALCQILDRLGIEHEVLGFSTIYDGITEEAYDRAREQMTELGRSFSRMEAIALYEFKRFDERVTHHVRARLVGTGMRDYSTGSLTNVSTRNNVDGESLMMAARRLLKRREARKVIMVLSDGSPASDGTGLEEHLKKCVKDCETLKVETIGIGIMDDSVKDYYPKNVVVEDIQELPGVVMTQLRRLLIDKKATAV